MGSYGIKQEDLNQAFDKMKNEITKNGIIIKEILCEPLNCGPYAIRNSIDYTADYIIEFLFLGEENGVTSIYNCYGYASGIISEYVLNRPGAYPDPKASLGYKGVENIKIEKVVGPIKEVIYYFHGWLKYEYEFIYQPVSKELEFHYLKLGHPDYSVGCSREIIKDFKIESFILENKHLKVKKSSNSEPILFSNTAYLNSPDSEDVFGRIEDIIKENNKKGKKQKVLTYTDK